MINKKILSIGAVAVMIGLGIGILSGIQEIKTTPVSSANINETSNINDDENLSNVQVYFAKDKSIKDLLKGAGEHKLQVVSLKSSFGVDEMTFTDFYLLPSKKINERKIERDYKKSREGFLLDTIENMKDLKSQKKGNAVEEITENTLNSFQRLQKEIRRENIKIKSAVVYGNIQNVKTAREKMGIVKIEKIGQAIQSDEADDFGSNQIKAGIPNANTWVPKRGSSYTGPSFPGGRFVSQYIWWDNVSGFNSTSTYEHDFFLNNYDGKTYLDASQSWSGMPNIIYAATNLPRPYLDSRAMDPVGEKAYVIGCSDADSIQANTGYWYFTYIRTANGNINTDKAKLQAQLAYRSPSWCYGNTWCVPNSLATVNLVPAWHMQHVPCLYYWQR